MNKKIILKKKDNLFIKNGNIDRKYQIQFIKDYFSSNLIKISIKDNKYWKIKRNNTSDVKNNFIINHDIDLEICNQFKNRKYINNLQNNQNVTYLILKLLVKYSNQVGDKNTIHKYLFTDGIDLIELIEYNCDLFNNIKQNDIIKINNILVSTKSINQKYDFIANSNNIILKSNDYTSIDLITSQSIRILNNVNYTNLYDISKTNYINKTLINIKCIAFDVKQAQVQNKSLTTFKGLDINSKLFIEFQLWNYNYVIYNYTLYEFNYCILNTTKGKIVNNDWLTQVNLISKVTTNVTDIYNYTNISQENVKYIKVKDFNSIINDTTYNDFNIEGNF